MRPAGIVVIDCDGVVVARGDWLGVPQQANQNFLMNLINNPPVSQAGACWWTTPRALLENALDSDGDGVCDQAELILGTTPSTVTSARRTEDSDGDGCDTLETDCTDLGSCVPWVSTRMRTASATSKKT